MSFDGSDQKAPAAQLCVYVRAGLYVCACHAKPDASLNSTNYPT